MVFVGLLGLFKFKGDKEDESDGGVTTKPPATEEKAGSFVEFTRLPETKKFVSEWMNKKKFTRRGVEKLLQVLWLQHDNNKKILKAASDILSALTGEDGLLKVLSGFKLIPDGLRRILK